jgi:hypothetical protein
MTFVHTISAYPSRLAPVRGPGAFRVCCTLLWYTCATGTGSTRRIRSVLCLPMQTLRAHTSHLAATRGTRRTASYDTP